jgi:hypothetical protein
MVGMVIAFPSKYYECKSNYACLDEWNGGEEI